MVVVQIQHAYRRPHRFSHPTAVHGQLQSQNYKIIISVSFAVFAFHSSAFQFHFGNVHVESLFNEIKVYLGKWEYPTKFMITRFWHQKVVFGLKAPRTPRRSFGLHSRQLKRKTGRATQERKMLVPINAYLCK